MLEVFLYIICYVINIRYIILLDIIYMGFKNWNNKFVFDLKYG